MITVFKCKNCFFGQDAVGHLAEKKAKNDTRILMMILNWELPPDDLGHRGTEDR